MKRRFPMHRGPPTPEEACDKSPKGTHKFAGYPEATSKCVYCGTPKDLEKREKKEVKEECKEQSSTP